MTHEKIRIATWNLERPRVDDDAKLDGLGEQIADIDADIWIFTESSEFVWPGERYFDFHSKHIENYVGHTPREVRTSIWAPYHKLKEIETHDPETSVCVQFSSPLGAHIIYATIIPYHNAGTNFPYRYMQKEVEGLKQWELHSQSIAAHAADIRKIRNRFPMSAFCLAGDFNQNRDGTRWYGTNAVREQMTEALKFTELKCVTEEDFRARGKLETRANIDHICLDHDTAEMVTRVEAWEAGYDENDKRLSDHNGVYVDLEFEQS